MVLHISRDYVSQNVTTANRTYISSYLLAIFLRRILKYTYVGDTAFPINAINSIFISTGDTTPTVAPTFPVNNKAGVANNGAAIEVSIPVAVKGVAAIDVGRILVLKSNLYPTRNSGMFLITALQQGNSTTIAAGSNNASLPQGTINVASTTGFPTSGNIFIGPSNSIASGSNGLSLPQATINVLSTTGFPATGSISILTSTGVSTVAYTGITASTFTGCTGGTGTMATGGTVTTLNNIQTIAYTNTTATTFTGCTGGTGTLITGEPVYNQNKYVVDYRGNGDLAIVEAVDTVEWYLYDKDINCPTIGNNNTQSSNSYRGNLDSTTPRVILQSPNVLAWQIRICNETATDFGTNGTCNVMTATPGFGGNSAGDFPVGGKHLHGGLWNNGTLFDLNSGNGFGDNAGTGAIYRYTFWGDDQSVSIIARRPSNGTSPPSFYATFGFPDNEPAPLPLDNTERLYFLGNAYGNGLGNNRCNDVALYTGYYANGAMQGAGFRYQPISCSPALWCYLTGNNQGASPIFDASAGDSPFISATELLPVDLVVGTVHNWIQLSASSAVTLPYFPKVIGTVPLLKNGRANFAEYTLTTDTGGPFTVSAATNASPIQVTTGTHTLVTGQTVTISGVLGNTATNGTFVVTVLNSTQFTLNGSTGNGAYTSGGTVIRGASFQHTRRGIFLPWNGPSVVP